MSIIGGILGEISRTQSDALFNAMSCYKTEAVTVVEDSQLYMACGIQHFTPESLNEKLPFQDEPFTITADAILDNREALIKSLHINQDLSDSQIILEAYKKWGTSCDQHLLGDYAFAIWDNSKKVLFCVRDHVGKRSFYYTQTGTQFIFCTVMAPILKVINEAPLNEKWLADFLAIQGVIHEICIDETVYKNIKQLPPGHQMLLTKESLKIEQYWYPEKVKPLKLDSDKAYEKAFREVFDVAVKCRLRSIENIGIMLSSGLDSTAVAAVAAPTLAAQGKKLFSFTEIPLATYENQMGHSKIINESSYVLDFQKLYPNIEPYFDSFETKNTFVDINKRIQVLEQPYKIIENLYWIEGLLETAHEKHCTVLLDGQFGNFSISQGNVFCYWNTLLHHGKWLRLIQEINIFCKKHHGSRKIAYKSIFKKLFRQLKYNKVTLDDLVPINPDLSDRYQCLKRIKQAGYFFNDNRILTEKEQKAFVTNLIMFSHMGSIETKHSLTYGVIRRDPTRDKRVIEFCLSVPQSQFVHEGIERSLIRRAMKGAVPDDIRLNYYSRGKQAADWLQRLEPYQPVLENELKDMLEDSTMKRYLDTQKLMDFLAYYKQNQDTDIYGFQLKSLMIALIFCRFIKMQANSRKIVYSSA